MSVHLGAEPTEHFKTLLEESFDQIEGAVAWVSRRLCLTGDDADEFRSWVNEKLIEDDYRVLREFAGRSKLMTYLVAVIQNLARDYRMKMWRRWRPSAKAERLGLVALQLETLLDRDGFTLDEASESLRSNLGVKKSHLEIVELAAKLPVRTPLRFEDDVPAVEASTGESRADESLRESEQRETLAKAQEALAKTLGDLSAEDRLVLKMHYQSGLTIAAIASALALDQRSLYTRRDRSLRKLKAGLEAKGLEGAKVFALGWPKANFEVNYALREAELDEKGPSNMVESGSEEDE